MLFFQTRLRYRCFLLNFVKLFKHHFYRTPSGDYFCIYRTYMLFFISNTFIRNARLKLAKLSQFENYSLSSSISSSQNNRRYLKNCTKGRCICFNEAIWLMTVKMKLKMKHRSLRCNINKPSPTHRHKYTKYKCISV